MKKAIMLLVVVFLGFWMFTAPESLADNAGRAGSGLWVLTADFFTAVIKFVGKIG